MSNTAEAAMKGAYPRTSGTNRSFTSRGSRQRVWLQTMEDEVQIVAVSDESIYWDLVSGSQADDLLRELESGKTAEDSFRDQASHIPFRRIERIAIDRSDDHDIDIIYREGKERQSVTISVDDQPARDDIYRALQASLQQRMKEYVDDYSVARSIFGGLVTFTVTGLLTWWLAAAALSIRAAESIEITGRKKGIKQLFVWVLDLLGPWGVGVAGTLVASLVAFYVVHRFRNPPSMLILQARPYRAPSPIATGIKYALLFLTWAWVISAVLR